METVWWSQLCDQVVDALGVKSQRWTEFDRIKDLYRHCVLAKLPDAARANDQSRISAFHVLVEASVKHIQCGWPNIRKSTVRDMLAQAKDSDMAHSDETKNVEGHQDIAHMNDAIDVALCLWLGIDCTDTLRHLNATSWPEQHTLGNFVLQRRFDVSMEADPGDYIKYFPSKFRAARLDEISGIKIEQTYYLDQHLRFNEDTRIVQIFMDVPWLQATIERFQTVMSEPASPTSVGVPVDDQGRGGQADAGTQQHPQPRSHITEMSQASSQPEIVEPKRESATPSKDPAILDPAGARSTAAKDLLPIFEEALRTLDILFPDWDGKTIDFVSSFRQNGKKVPWFNLDDMAPQMPQGLHKFKHWRARFTTLIIEHQSPPKDFKHIWNDRRNPMAFWTFWIGMAIFLLTFAFGTIASVLAGLTLAKPGA